jgi:hypothetical protein
MFTVYAWVEPIHAKSQRDILDPKYPSGSGKRRAAARFARVDRVILLQLLIERRPIAPGPMKL